jgi:hypothetical protein
VCLSVGCVSSSNFNSFPKQYRSAVQYKRPWHDRAPLIKLRHVRAQTFAFEATTSL